MDIKEIPLTPYPLPRAPSSGQAMILAVLMLGGAILGVTTVAGLLMLYQIRQSSDFQSSAKSIFAADSGVEWALYNHFKGAVPLPTPSNGAVVSAVCYDSSNAAIACDNASSSYAVANGTAGNSKRAFFVDLTNATSAFP